MPGDLLRYLGGPIGFSGWWWLLVGLCAAAIIGWHACIYVWTLPAARLRGIPVIGGLHARLLRRRFARSVAETAESYRAGRLSATEAAAAISRTLRSFLHVTTGARAQYMHIGDITGHNGIAHAAPAFAALNDVQFSLEHNDIDRVEALATEVIRTWS